ncbi:hypothetical protein WN55_06205 [Dufourea novaeangliae]|uniref:Uncharacterized protein n=1 Tax=Dufourea novaeangliae TaxID=178035 RepID=A0A154PRC0_DUFNO|nr:hypothetical protein WN55_06205 [Dufourea novaeangliae]
MKRVPLMPESWDALPPPLPHSDVPLSPTMAFHFTSPCWHTQAHLSPVRVHYPFRSFRRQLVRHLAT